MRDHSGHRKPSSEVREKSIAVPGRSSLTQPTETGEPATGRAPSLFNNVPWANRGMGDEAQGAQQQEAACDAHDAGAEEAAPENEHAAEDSTNLAANDPTNLAADAAIDDEMIGGDGKRLAAGDPDAATDAPLPHREQMERTFGTDLGGVTARLGADLSELGAQAAAEGDHVVFADPNPSPALVAHEVAHVIQQRRAGMTSVAASRTIAPENSPAEHEAERTQQHVERGGNRVGAVTAPPGGGVHLSRAPGGSYAKQDRYNKGAVRSNHKRRGKRDLDRAGVRVGEHADVWKLDGASADRYRIKNGNEAEKVDTIKDTAEIAINPARTRQLNLPGIGPTDCCFVWARGFGAAWLPIAKLQGKHDAKIKKAINKRADAWRPAVHPGETEAWHFAVGGSSLQANDEWIRPNSGGTPDRIQDYLEKTVGNGNGQKRTYFNVMMNLPQQDAAPVAIDFAQPTDMFFVVKGMEREISLWKANERGRPTGGKQRWVFGYLAKDGAPDKARRGWVPKRVLRRGKPG